MYTDFGPINANAIRSGDSFVTIPISNDLRYGDFWSVMIDAYRFSEYQTGIYTFEPRFGIIQSGTSSIAGPTSFITEIVN